MQRRRVLIAIALAVAMGFVASYVVYQAVKTAQGKNADTEQLAVAAANISVGEALTAQHIKMADWPKSTIPAGAVRSAKDAEGRMARASIVTGEPLLEAKLAPAGQGGLMPVLVPTGKRGVTIKVDEAIQKSGFVVPNSRVDVLVTHGPPHGYGDRIVWRGDCNRLGHGRRNSFSRFCSRCLDSRGFRGYRRLFCCNRCRFVFKCTLFTGTAGCQKSGATE